jgi:hypothetical protein
MPTTRLNLPQQFGRFILTGASVFTVFFWGLSSILLSDQDLHRDFSVLRVIFKACAHESFTTWISGLESAYIPFFLAQKPLMVCYLLSTPLAWLAAFVFDGRILRQENTL